MKVEEKRGLRTYKAKEAEYKKALKRGQKEGKPLARLLEKVVGFYSKGFNIAVNKGNPILSENIYDDIDY